VHGTDHQLNAGLATRSSEYLRPVTPKTLLYPLGNSGVVKIYSVQQKFSKAIRLPWIYPVNPDEYSQCAVNGLVLGPTAVEWQNLGHFTTSI
jgi:hypothetical protein